MLVLLHNPFGFVILLLTGIKVIDLSSHYSFISQARPSDKVRSLLHIYSCFGTQKCTRQFQKVTWDMINSLTFFYTCTHISIVCHEVFLHLYLKCWSQGKLKFILSHSTLRSCRLHLYTFLGQPFSKQLYMCNKRFAFYIDRPRLTNINE